jgi:hypothetical protein
MLNEYKGCSKEQPFFVEGKVPLSFLCQPIIGLTNQ